MTVGVLAVQGDFAEHAAVLRSLGVDTAEVRLPDQLEAVDALILPGGESTTIARLMDLYHLREPVIRRVRDGMAVWGTCAGMIMLASRLRDDRPQPLGLMDMEVARNAFGRQVDSFEADIVCSHLDGGPLQAVFIRAPSVVAVGPSVEVLATLADGTPVAVREGKMLATAFHPELTEDRRLHAAFVASVADASVADASVADASVGGADGPPAGGAPANGG